MEVSMKISSFLGAVVLIGGLFLPAAPSFAHHSFAAEFDGRNCKDFTGILTKLDWQSPHPYFFMDIKERESAAVSASIPPRWERSTQRSRLRKNRCSSPGHWQKSRR